MRWLAAPTRRIALTLLGIGLVGTALLAARAPGDCWPGGICGTVDNESATALDVTWSWCTAEQGPCGATVGRLGPGASTHNWRNRRGGRRDIDGYLVARGCAAMVAREVWHSVGSPRPEGPGWHKLRTDEVVHVRSMTCG
jgi:hypothetical protein